MSKSKKKETQEVPDQEMSAEEVLEERTEPEEALPEEPQTGGPGEEPEGTEETPIVEQMVSKDQFLRLAAEYDNYRKRTAKEKESLWTDAKDRKSTL